MNPEWQLVVYILSVLLVGWSLGIITYDISLGEHKVLRDLIQALRVFAAWVLKVVRGKK